MLYRLPMWRAGMLVCMVAACSGADMPPPAAAGQTELVVTVQYDPSMAIDEFSVTGTALAQNRSFGPFDSKGSDVQSGATVALLFDPNDAGTANVCIEGRSGGMMVASGCATFPVVADGLSQGTLQLTAAQQQPPPLGNECRDLQMCCANLPAAQIVDCEATATMGNEDACRHELNGLQWSGLCH